jgi:hypothetical protein
MSSQHNTGADGARFHLRKSGGTLANPTAVGTAWMIGRLVGAPYDGTAYLEMASIDFVTSGTIGTNRVPTSMIFSVATDASPSVLTERMRNIISPKKASVDEWVRAMETCHEVGLPGSANIVIGSEETKEEVIEHLNVVRNLQDRTGGFLSFIPWTFQPQTKKFFIRHVPTHEYLKVLGICRIFLDNIPHIETSVMVLGKGVGELALYSGADDISSIVIEENVLKKTPAISNNTGA